MRSNLAHRYAKAAYKAACQAEEPALCAQILVAGAWLDVGTSTMGLQAPGDPSASKARWERALGTLRLAHEVGGKAASPWTLAQLGALQAQSNASLGRLDLLLAYAHQGQIDAALDAGGPTCRLASEFRIDSVRICAREIRSALAPHRHIPDVQQLDGRLRDLAA